MSCVAENLLCAAIAHGDAPSGATGRFGFFFAVFFSVCVNCLPGKKRGGSGRGFGCGRGRRGNTPVAGRAEDPRVSKCPTSFFWPLAAAHNACGQALDSAVAADRDDGLVSLACAVACILFCRSSSARGSFARWSFCTFTPLSVTALSMYAIRSVTLCCRLRTASRGSYRSSAGVASSSTSKLWSSCATPASTLVRSRTYGGSSSPSAPGRENESRQRCREKRIGIEATLSTSWPFRGSSMASAILTATAPQCAKKEVIRRLRSYLTAPPSVVILRTPWPR